MLNVGLVNVPSRSRSGGLAAMRVFSGDGIYSLARRHKTDKETLRGAEQMSAAYTKTV
jgi:hypothetical protein